ncbi:hypothetical protein VP1G_11008 [Cytospora mali]|uniref:Uncharacterized protein n=1 Tax=Cytospora mali TaxID=578113 RepID=A0A194V300_CYTMA|nr:hypothetical protein VP1G_11008 [Valsa mali var. pyri (nom. inval.)]
MRLCNENSRKKGKKQGGESETKASSRSPDTCNVAISCESQEPRSGRGFDNTGLNSENHMGEQEDEVDYDDDDDDDDNGSGSEYNANDAGDHSLGFFDQDMTMSNGSVPRRDIWAPSAISDPTKWQIDTPAYAHENLDTRNNRPIGLVNNIQKRFILTLPSDAIQFRHFTQGLF